MKDTFKQLYKEHQGKVSDKWSLYLSEWEHIFSDYRNKEIVLVEIGIQNGGSLEIWSRYFSNAKKIIGCDINEKCEFLTFSDPRIKIIVGDANSSNCEEKIFSQYEKADIIIDDGSHTSKDIILSFARYFPRLKDEGIYVIEDLHCSYWEMFQGGLHNPFSSISFFKRIVDLINYEHWRNNKSRKYLLEKFEKRFGTNFDDLDLARIHSIEFINSLCVIKKSSPEKNVVGKRIITGSQENVTTNWEKLKNTNINDIAMKIEEGNLDIFDLIDNSRTLEEGIAELRSKHNENEELILDLKKQLNDLSTTIENQSEEITNLLATLETRDGEITNLLRVLRDRDKEISDLSKTLTEREKLIVDLDREVFNRGEWALGLEAELIQEREKLSESLEKLNDALKSNSWRITFPLRETKLWLSAPSQQIKRYNRKSLTIAKKIYQHLPLKPETIESHRKLLADKSPNLLLKTDTRFDGNEKKPIEIENAEELYVPEIPRIERFFDGSYEPAIFAKSIDVTNHTEPLVSIIIPVYGKIEFTLNCLASIEKYPPQVPFEVIVVDDCSNDGSAEVLEKVRGICLVRNTENLGFIKSCNLGASKALGKYLYFLNNDAQLLPASVDELLRTFHYFPGTGLVGSKLIYPDGKLQEAGGIIWQDGTAWNFGRFQNPQLPVFNYAREVDYCSGASIMLGKSLFQSMGGFDERYSPAYCEDSDLALKIRNKGYRVIYQPLSTIIHYEGVTSGGDTSKGVKSYQIENSKKLYERWKDKLKTHQIPGLNIDKEKDRRANKRVLILEHCTLTPDQDAGSVTVFNLLLLLREMDFQVTFIPEDNFLYDPQYTSDLQRIGIEVLYSPYINSVEQHVKEYGERYDLVFLFRPRLVHRNIKNIRQYCSKAKVLYYTHDLHFLRMSREAEILDSTERRNEAEEMKQIELSAISLCDASILVSQPELETIEKELPEISEKLHILPLILEVKSTESSFKSRENIVFVGGFQHTPNIDAVKYFVKEIMPILRQKLPGVIFYAVGSKVPEEIQSLASEDVVITGFVKDLTSFLNNIRVSVAPLRYGAGVKGKIGTAMAVGLPVVATSVAAEGMSLIDGENIFIADDPTSFADQIVKLYKDENLWNCISKKGKETAELLWGAESAWENLSKILNDIDIDVRRSHYLLSLYSEQNELLSERKIVDLLPISSVADKSQFASALKNKASVQMDFFEKRLLEARNSDFFDFEGFCIPCNKQVGFTVDMQWGGKKIDNIWTPNWRESLLCPFCKMNNRQRLIATLVKQFIDSHQDKKVYFMEQITPIFQWVKNNYPNCDITGSEYLGFEYKSGEIVNAIRHEDIENLSFSNENLDLIISNDVFEHVPNPVKGFSECGRVLKKGGTMLVTMPFFENQSQSVTRAEIFQGSITHILEPAYHGNPINTEGSLVFTDFGWDILTEIKKAGFDKVELEIYRSIEFGHLGNGQLVFRLRKLA